EPAEQHQLVGVLGERTVGLESLDHRRGGVGLGSGSHASTVPGPCAFPLSRSCAYGRAPPGHSTDSRPTRTARSSSSLRCVKISRASVGVIPNAPRKRALKWLWWLKPVSTASAAMS